MNVLLVPAHPGFPGQIPQSRKTVVVVVVVIRKIKKWTDFLERVYTVIKRLRWSEHQEHKNDTDKIKHCSTMDIKITHEMSKVDMLG